jgi:Ca-activated chloride channel family protein
MEIIQFGNPIYLYALALVPVVYVLFLFMHRKRKKIIEAMGRAETLNSFSKTDLIGRNRREGLFASLALFFILFALAKPQAGTRLEPVAIKGSDIYIAIDLSQSMRAEDIKPNRLERAKIAALELIDTLEGDRAGIVFFAGDAFVQCPLTSDYDALVSVINALSFETAVSSGTSVAAPLELAMNTMKPEDDHYAVMLLLTDGENTGPSPERVIRELADRDIKVFSIGIATTSGAPIPVYDESGQRTGYKKDQKGKVVISQLDDFLLRDIAERTGGEYFKITDTFDEIRRFNSALDTLKKREYETKRYTVYEERFQIPLALGILFLLIYTSALVRVGRTLS